MKMMSRATIDAGFPAARVYPESSKTAESHPNEIRIILTEMPFFFPMKRSKYFKLKAW